MKNREPPPMTAAKRDREKRLAAALRANLKRRKAAMATGGPSLQSRGREPQGGKGS